ncbi:hypothetical protein OR1_02774 [Geobacter sp. OR-1]|uniref:hypothetical protein n=1 Tax=Geobacter sp. OR-1 TaxID=1266765 RepID=UPI000543D808|nr:hypothetical protein [Geobacter sp. OR-1]GAM10485.1 hypothetical protein OR1_02774 [Geobacter sp. OR-1]
MSVSTVSSQAMMLKEQMTLYQLGMESIKQQADSQQKMASMLNQQAQKVAPPKDPQGGGFSTYA